MSDYPDLSAISAMPPGPELITELLVWGPMPRTVTDAQGLPEMLPDAEGQVVIAKAWQRVAAWVDSQLNRAILDVAGRQPLVDEEDWGREEVAAALRMSEQGAAERIDVARVLATRRFQTGRALDRGEITYRHAAEIVKGLQPLDDDEAAELAERRLLDGARTKTPAQTASRARKEVIKADPDGAEKRRRQARSGRRVDFFPLPDAMMEIRAFVPAEGAAQVRICLNRLAGRSREKGDTRTIDQRRADALVALSELGMFAADHPTIDEPKGDTEAGDIAPTENEGSRETFPERWSRIVTGIVMGRRAAPPRVALVASLSTALAATNEPGDLTGYGPVPPSIVRELAGDGQWEKWLADRGGVVTDLGRSVYRPTAPLAALVRATYPTCMFPGCSQPSYRCDLDHNVRRIDGGPTSQDNLLPLCRRHHRAKDEGGWQIRHDADRKTCTWISPAGHSYTVSAPAHDVDDLPHGDSGSEPSDLADRESPLVTASVGAPDAAGADDDEAPPF